MPRRSYRYGRRRRFRKRNYRRTYRTRTRRMVRPRRSIAQRSVNAKFVMVANAQSQTAGVGGQQEFFTASAFDLASRVPSASLVPFETAYDYYKISKIKMEFFMTPVIPSTSNDFIYGDTADGPTRLWFMATIDLNDVIPPTDHNYFSSIQNPKIVALPPTTKRRFAKFYWKPTVLLEAGGVQSNPKRSPWLGTDTMSIQHYGIKYGFYVAPEIAEDTRINYAVKVTLYTKWKGRAIQPSS